MKMSNATNIMPYAWPMLLNAESEEPKVLALNRFQNCSITKVVKNMVRRWSVMPPSAWLYV